MAASTQAAACGKVAATRPRQRGLLHSAASLWEIAIKSGLRRKDFRIDLDAVMKALRASGFLELPITAVHAAGVAQLPPIHKDPFDRLLVSQSMAEPMTLLTNDAALADYWDGIKLV